MNDAYPLPTYLQLFFTDRLINQKDASPNTVASYRDTFRLLLRFAREQTGRAQTELRVGDIDANLVGRFLTFCEEERGNSARSRNTRLAAIRSFFKYVEVNEPQLLLHCQKVLAIPTKRYDKRVIDYLTQDEIQALLDAPACSSSCGRRDRTLLLLMIQTGLRVSEVIGLRIQDVQLGQGAHVRCTGKGRKERSTPLRSDSRRALRNFLAERGGDPGDPLFITASGTALSRDAVERLVRKYAGRASEQCSTLANKRVTPHVLRHTAAMQLLQNGVDRTVIALWLGHESVETTQMYVHADIQLKERAMARTNPVEGGYDRFRPTDDDLEFLDSL